MENTQKLTIEIYKNNEKVNTFEYLDEKEIYKQLAQALYCKETKRASRTTIKSNAYEIEEITQVFDTSKTQLDNTKYTYIYKFKNVRI